MLDVVLATVALLLVLRASGTDRPVLALVAGGFILYAVADLAFSVLAEQDRFHFGTPLDLGWIAGYLRHRAGRVGAQRPRRTTLPARAGGRACRRPRHAAWCSASSWWRSVVQFGVRRPTTGCRPRRPRCGWC